MIWWLLIGVLVLYIFSIAYKSRNYWKNRGVTHIKPFPFIGNTASNIFQRISLAEQMQMLYNVHPNAKYVGLQQMTSHVLMLRDPELIKQIFVKDFDYFMNHGKFFDEEAAPLFGKSLFLLKGQRWKDMRSTLSPAFTSSKMRAIYVLITEAAEQFVEYFLKEAKEQNGIITVEMKEVMARYTNDVIATSAFGIKCDSLTDKDNDFFTTGKKISDIGLLDFIKMMLFVFMPRLMKGLGFTITDKSVDDFFRNIIKTTIATREKEGIIRPDMIHLLMEARKGRLKHEISSQSDEGAGFATVEESSIGQTQSDTKPELTDEDITAQAFLFFLAGYDTSSALMGFMAYELALNPDIQVKLQAEIDEVYKKCNGKIGYETILKMKYLDMTVSETLRKWPPSPFIERECVKTYTFENTNDGEPKFVLEKNVSVWAPVYGIHRDPKYFSDPDRFNPERFNDENKDSITPFTYLPFGVGPRNCIGSRFALLEIKAVFVHLLAKFDITVVEKTQIPLKLNKKTFNMHSEKGVWLGLKLRNLIN